MKEKSMLAGESSFGNGESGLARTKWMVIMGIVGVLVILVVAVGYQQYTAYVHKVHKADAEPFAETIASAFYQETMHIIAAESQAQAGLASNIPFPARYRNLPDGATMQLSTTSLTPNDSTPVTLTLTGPTSATVQSDLRHSLVSYGVKNPSGTKDTATVSSDGKVTFN